MKKIRLISLTVLFALCAQAQMKKVSIPDSSKTFYDIKKEFEDFWKGKDLGEEDEEDEREGTGYEIFKRWAQ